MIVDSNIPHQSLQQCQLSPDFVEDDEKMEKRLKSLSGGLAEVKIYQYKPVALFIHQSVNDYLIKEGLQILDSLLESEDVSIGRAHVQLSRSCISYIAMDKIHQWRGKYAKALEDEFPFLRYTTTSWLLHAKVAEAKEMSQGDLLDYLCWLSAQIMQDWVGIYRFIDKYSDECPYIGTTLLHTASRHGLISTVRPFLIN